MKQTLKTEISQIPKGRSWSFLTSHSPIQSISAIQDADSFAACFSDTGSLTIPSWESTIACWLFINWKNIHNTWEESWHLMKMREKVCKVLTWRKPIIISEFFVSSNAYAFIATNAYNPWIAIWLHKSKVNK